MHWIDSHQGLVAAIALGVLAIAGILVFIALVKVVRQGRRAMFGAHPVIGVPEFGNADDGGLVLVVPFANAAASPAFGFSARVKADRVQAGAPAGSVTLYGYGADPAANRVRIAFDWPVGILDADVSVRWSWRDASGSYDDAWRGHLRVPEPEMPDELPGADPTADDHPGAAAEGAGQVAAHAIAATDSPRVDPLSHIRSGTAKAAKPAESGD
jgi:hypothetical protein